MTASGATRASALTTQVTRTLDEAVDLAPEWEALAERSEAGPFARPAYALGWWRALGQHARGARLLVVSQRRDGRLVALAPLHERRAGPAGVVRWLGHGLGTVAEALVAHDEAYDETAAALWTEVARHPGRVLQLVECREGRGGLDLLTSGRTGVAVSATQSDRCPFFDVVGPADEHLADPRHSRMRRAVRVARRRLTVAGLEHRVGVATDPDQFAAVLPDLLQVFDRAEHAQPRQHLMRPPWGDFTTGYLTESMAAGTAVVSVGYLGDAPVSFDIVLLANRTMHSWIGRFDPVAAAYSPGHLLQAAEVDWAAAHGIRRIDLLLGDVEYKRRWATDSYGTLDVTAGRPAVHAAAVTGLRTLSRLRERGRVR